MSWQIAREMQCKKALSKKTLSKRTLKSKRFYNVVIRYDPVIVSPAKRLRGPSTSSSANWRRPFRWPIWIILFLLGQPWNTITLFVVRPLKRCESVGWTSWQLKKGQGHWTSSSNSCFKTCFIDETRKSFGFWTNEREIDLLKRAIWIRTKWLRISTFRFIWVSKYRLKDFFCLLFSFCFLSTQFYWIN